jgi:hypothetical protein
MGYGGYEKYGSREVLILTRMDIFPDGTNRIKRSDHGFPPQELFVSDDISETAGKSVVASHDCEILVKIKVRYSTWDKSCN